MSLVEISVEQTVDFAQPQHIRLHGLLAGITLREISGLAGSGFEYFGVTALDASKVSELKPPKRESSGPAEKYFLNGAQYLTGGNGNRLEFS